MQPKKIAVSDSSSLILMTKTGLIKDASKIFTMMIPEKVLEETVTRGKELKKEDAFVIEKEIKENRLKVHKAGEIKEVKNLAAEINIGKGETEALYLYFRKKAHLLLTDDKQAIKMANVLGIRWAGVPNIAVLMFEMDLINYENALEVLSKLEKYGRYKLDYLLAARNLLEKIKEGKGGKNAEK